MNFSRRMRSVGKNGVWLAVLAVLCAVPVRAQERPEALVGVSIGSDYTPSDFEQAGRIERIVGDGKVVVLHRAEKEAFYASVEDPVQENDAVFTLGEVRCRILLEDKNVVTMAPDSDLFIDEVVLDDAKGEKRSLFEVTRGKALFYAIRLFRFRDVRLHVKTPTATVGVRGTKFGTEIAEAPARGEEQGRIQVASNGPVRLAQAPAGLLTRIFVAQGLVNVVSSTVSASTTLGENEVLEAGPFGLGPAQYDPQAVRSFMEGVEGPMASGGRTGPASPGSGPPADSGKQQQDELMRQLDQVEEAKELQSDRTFEPEHDSGSEPSGQAPSPPSPLETHPHSP
jgi:hypothetical protein